MHPDVNFNTAYIILTLIFACGVSYATIKVSLKSMTEQFKHLNKKVAELEEQLRELEIEKRLNGFRFDSIQRTLDAMSKDLSKIADDYIKLEKRGMKQWQSREQDQSN